MVPVGTAQVGCWVTLTVGVGQVADEQALTSICTLADILQTTFVVKVISSKAKSLPLTEVFESKSCT